MPTLAVEAVPVLPMLLNITVTELSTFARMTANEMVVSLVELKLPILDHSMIQVSLAALVQ
jgi:hypothetical protein